MFVPSLSWQTFGFEDKILRFNEKDVSAPVRGVVGDGKDNVGGFVHAAPLHAEDALQRKHSFYMSVSYMFVPSLSWQNDHVY